MLSARMEKNVASAADQNLGRAPAAPVRAAFGVIADPITGEIPVPFHERFPTRAERIQNLYALAQGIARRVGRTYRKADVDELISDGCVGLIRAVDTFDPTRGVALEIYARRLIIGSIFNGLRKRDPLSSRVRKALRKVDDERFEIASREGSLPSMVEMEQRDGQLGAIRTKALQRSTVSLDAPLPSGEKLGTSTANDPQNIAVERSLVQSALSAINTLPNRQREVMLLYYMQQVSLPTIADRMGITRQRASQIHRQALESVRKVVIA